MSIDQDFVVDENEVQDAIDQQEVDSTNSVSPELENEDETAIELEDSDHDHIIDDENSDDEPKLLKLKHNPDAKRRSSSGTILRLRHRERVASSPTVVESVLDRTEESTDEDELIDPNSLFYITEEEENGTAEVSEMPVSHQTQITPTQRNDNRKKSTHKIKILTDEDNESNE